MGPQTGKIRQAWLSKEALVLGGSDGPRTQLPQGALLSHNRGPQRPFSHVVCVFFFVGGGGGGRGNLSFSHWFVFVEGGRGEGGEPAKTPHARPGVILRVLFSWGGGGRGLIPLIQSQPTQRCHGHPGSSPDGTFSKPGRQNPGFVPLANGKTSL